MCRLPYLRNTFQVTLQLLHLTDHTSTIIEESPDPYKFIQNNINFNGDMSNFRTPDASNLSIELDNIIDIEMENSFTTIISAILFVIVPLRFQIIQILVRAVHQSKVDV